MIHLFWLTPDQLRRIGPPFPRPHGVLRVDNLRVVSRIIQVIHTGLRRCEAATDYGPYKTLYNRFVDGRRWRV